MSFNYSIYDLCFLFNTQVVLFSSWVGGEELDFIVVEIEPCGLVDLHIGGHIAHNPSQTDVPV